MTFPDNAKTPKVLCVIPARGGSKGLPNKNLLEIGGVPLIAHPIKYALKSKLITKLIVSTDSPEIAKVAEKFGAEIPFLRPIEIASDLATTESVLTHAISTIESTSSDYFDYCVFLTSTSIFRPEGLIDLGINTLEQNPSLDSFFSGFETTKNYWQKESGAWTRLLPWMRTYSSRQVRDSIVREDTGVACVSRAQIWRDGRRIGDKVHIEMNKDELSSLDIHTLEDFKLVEFALELRSANDSNE
jgi:CMP-N,N'-diacetyllegionaminic acid synthase